MLVQLCPSFVSHAHPDYNQTFPLEEDGAFRSVDQKAFKLTFQDHIALVSL